MNHRLKVLALSLALATSTGAAMAQTIHFNPRSGDVWVDTWLGDMNSYGTRYREPFISEIVRTLGAPRDVVGDLLGRNGWTPGDVYYACSIANVLGRPCRDIANEYDRDRGQGWGVLAKRMGIKPGSAEFHRLKKGMVGSYDRWGRPIVLDDQLRRDYPNRGVARKSDGSKAKSAAMQHHGHGTGKMDHAVHGKVKADGRGKGVGKPAHDGGKGKGGGKK